MPANVVTTARDLVTLAMKSVGAVGEGQEVSAEDAMDGLKRMNWLLAQWRRKRWLVFCLQDLSFVSTGADSYTIGPGGTINMTPRTDKIESAYLRQIIPSQPQPVDFPMDVITSYEEYSRIPLKTLSSFAYSVFYDSAYPLGNLFPWPVPEANIYEVHVIVKNVLQRFETLDDEIELPEEYEPAICSNLAIRLAPTFTLPVTPEMVAEAKDALNVMRQANVAITPLIMPAALTRPGIYDPYSDQTR